MTDPKLPPLPRDSWNGMYSEQQIQEHWLDGYRAGQSSAEPMTREEALALANKHDISVEHPHELKAILDAIIAASRRAPVADQRAVPEGWRTVPVEPTDAMVEVMKNGPADYHYRDIEGQIKAAYRRAIAAAPTPPAGEQWISVEERMPEHDVDVLVSFLSTAQVVAYFDSQPEKEGFVWQTMDGPAYRAEAVTHWMPLPTPPKGGQEP